MKLKILTNFILNHGDKYNKITQNNNRKRWLRCSNHDDGNGDD